jgi:hypothetical protein
MLRTDELVFEPLSGAATSPKTAACDRRRWLEIDGNR